MNLLLTITHLGAFAAGLIAAVLLSQLLSGYRSRYAQRLSELDAEQGGAA